MRCLLEDAGIVTECRDGDKALEAFVTQQPDWVMMDVSMRGMDGFTAAGQIKTAFADARIVLLSQDAEPEYRTRAAALGAIFIPKEDVAGLQRLIRSGFPTGLVIPPPHPGMTPPNTQPGRQP
jgi:two-component system response regulator DesR